MTDVAVIASKEPVAERIRRVHREVGEEILVNMNDMFTTQGYGTVTLEIPFENGVPQCYKVGVNRRHKVEAA